MRILLSFFLLALSCAHAQSFTGRILGTVGDSSGAVVPQAAVSIINTATNIKTDVRSDSPGNYIAPLLPPGDYRVEVEAAAFKKFVREGITLEVDQRAQVDIVLSVGAVTESVLVTANVALLETTSSSIGKVVDNRRILELPLNSHLVTTCEN